MNQRNSVSTVAVILAVFGLLVGGFGLFLSMSVRANMEGEMAAMAAASSATVDAAVARADTAVNRIGLPVAELDPAHPTDVANVVKDPTDLPAPITRTEPTTVRVTLTAREVTAELADGTTYDFWTFDNTVPGPMIRVMEGDILELTLVNTSENMLYHNIDLHAVNGPGGGADATNVKPGESATFSFKATHTGAYVYHCAFAPAPHHIAQGMYGAIIVEPVGGLPPVDREFYVMQGEWYTVGRFGMQGHQLFSNEKAMAEQPEYFTMNGHVNALTTIHPLQANVGEDIRIFFGVGGPNIGSNFHVIGEIFDKVYTGAPETFIANEETWYTPPGSVATFELHLDEPGNYTLVDHALFRTQKGAAGILHVSGEWNHDLYSPEVGGDG